MGGGGVGGGGSVTSLYRCSDMTLHYVTSISMWR